MQSIQCEMGGSVADTENFIAFWFGEPEMRN